MGAVPIKISISLAKIEDNRTIFQVPQAEVSRNATSELVITSSYFKFPKNGIDDNNENATVSQKFPADCVEDSVCLMKTRFQYDCKIFTWPSPEL